MKIAVYGGSFCPSHLGHLLCASTVLATEDVDELWFTPTFKHMLGKQLIDFDHRVEMIRIMCRYLGGRASVSVSEKRLAKRPDFQGSATVDLIRDIVSDWPNDQFRFVIGSDLVQQARTWDGWDEVQRLAPLIVVDRAGYATNSPPGLQNLIIPDISSTTVRAAIRSGADISRIVPREIVEYINKHNLYR